MEFVNEQKIVTEAITTWIPINSQVREEIVHTIKITELNLQDILWQWSSWTREDHLDVFSIKETKKRPYEFRDNIHIQLTFELSLDMTVIDRQVYSLLDWLGDIGGLGEALFFLGGGLLLILKYGQLDQMLVNALYQVKAKPDDTQKVDHFGQG